MSFWGCPHPSPVPALYPSDETETRIPIALARWLKRAVRLMSNVRLGLLFANKRGQSNNSHFCSSPPFPNKNGDSCLNCWSNRGVFNNACLCTVDRPEWSHSVCYIALNLITGGKTTNHRRLVNIYMNSTARNKRRGMGAGQRWKENFPFKEETFNNQEIDNYNKC